mmetsp:Transcript_109673/g.153629  ORF Transcript_109673/g.153629 Transcript_109673/m.153629 type:complete len:611 (-) Transcript_109673:523-2355(-)
MLSLGAIGEDAGLTLQALLRARFHVLGGEAELLQAGATRRGGTEAIDAHLGRRELPPAGCDRGLHAQGGDTLGQERLLVAVWLRPEDLNGGHGDHPDLRIHGFACFEADVDLRARADNDDLRVLALEHLVSSLQGVLDGRVGDVRQSLPREGHHGRPGLVLGALHRVLVGTGSLIAIRRSHHGQIRNQAQRGEGLDRLVRWTVLAHSNRVVGGNKDGASLREGRDTDGRAHVVSEDGEGSAVRDDACLVQRQGVAYGSHAEFSDAEAEVPLGVAVLQEVASALHQGHVRGCQVGGTAHELRQDRGDGIEAVLRVKARGLAIVLWCQLGQALLPVVGQFPVQHCTLELCRKLRLLLLVGCEELVPLALLLDASICLLLESGIDVLWDLELAVVPAQLLAGRFGLVCAEGSSVRIVAVGLVGRSEANGGLHLDESGLVSAGLGLGNGLADGAHVLVAVVHDKHLPAVGLEALADILREGKIGVPIDGDAIVIVEGDELSKPQVAGISASLVRDTLLHAAISCNGVSVVVDQGEIRLVVGCCHVCLGRCQANGIGDSHAKRSSGDLDSGRLEILWMARCLGTPLPELLQVVHRHAVVSGQVQQGVLQHAAVAR